MRGGGIQPLTKEAQRRLLLQLRAALAEAETTIDFETLYREALPLLPSRMSRPDSTGNFTASSYPYPDPKGCSSVSGDVPAVELVGEPYNT